MTDSSVRTYVLDTSVLLSDPWALNRFDEHEVILPLVVIGELEAKRHHPELGYFARRRCASWTNCGSSTAGWTPGAGRHAGGTLHVELNHTDSTVLPAGFRNDSNDSRILACALNLAAEGQRRRPGHQGHAAAGQGRRGRVWPPTSTGRRTSCRPAGPGWPSCPCTAEQVDTLFHAGLIDVDEARELPCHTGVKLVTPSRALGRVTPASRSGWSAGSGRRSGCAAGRPSSGSRSTC